MVEVKINRNKQFAFLVRLVNNPDICLENVTSKVKSTYLDNDRTRIAIKNIINSQISTLK